jgi:hypothetical protein
MTTRLCLLSVVLLVALITAQQGGEPLFVPVKIDGPVHDPDRHTYWYGPFSECASVLDVDGDGRLDIAAGRNWYQAPDWIKHENFRDGAETNGPETDDNSEFAMDVNRDGRMDIVSSGWMRMKGAFWYENPGQPGVRWKAYRIHSAQSMEGVIHGDIDGDGDEDILVNHWSLVPGQGMTWLEHIDGAPWFKEHVIGTQGEIHGNGLGDINGDGRVDIVTPVGWYEGPPRPAEQPWPFHADYRFEGGAASHPILVYDVNGDGLNDIIIGSAHAYGLAWLEQRVDSSGQRSFTHHWVERNFGGFHTMALGDLDGDGKPELVAGKRLFPHHGRDIGEFDPLFVFWYKIRDGQFERHVLSYNHLPWYPEVKTTNPPPDGAIGVGMKLNIRDVDGDGRNDIVCAGKSGLYVFYNRGFTPSPKTKNLLPPETTYPSWIEWATPAAPRRAGAYTLAPETYGMELKTPDGRTVFRYMTVKPERTNLAANSVCCFHPLNTPSGERLTDLAPGDHHHHRGVFLAWHSMEFRQKADFTAFGPTGPTRGWNINRGDFWGWGQFAPTQGRVIKNRDVKLIKADSQGAEVEIRNAWMIDDKTMMDETTSAEVRERDGVYVLDLSYLLAPAQELVLNHTAFGGFCVRARNDGDSYYAKADGKVGLPDPHYSVPELNWPPAEWYDYTITLKDGKTIGAAVLDHPGNPPSTWHNPRYVWMINPCIVANGPVTVKQGQPLRLRYRLVVHDGPTPVELLQKLSREWRGR